MDYQRQRELYERIDAILTESKLDEEFLRLALNDHGIDPTTTKPKRLAAFARFSFVCLRANLARKLTGLAHREFCARLADSPLLQWFLHVGQIDQVKIFAKSTSHRFENWIGPESQRALHQRLIALCIALPEDAQPQRFKRSGIEAEDCGSKGGDVWQSECPFPLRTREPGGTLNDRAAQCVQTLKHPASGRFHRRRS